MAIYSGFSYEKLWFSIVMLNYQRVNGGSPIAGWFISWEIPIAGWFRVPPPWIIVSPWLLMAMTQEELFMVMIIDGHLVGGLEHFLFSHILGIIIPTDLHIFQRGSNHQPVIQSLMVMNCYYTTYWWLWMWETWAAILTTSPGLGMGFLHTTQMLMTEDSPLLPSPVRTKRPLYEWSQLYNDITLWLFNIAMENGPFIDGLPGFTY